MAPKGFTTLVKRKIPARASPSSSSPALQVPASVIPEVIPAPSADFPAPEPEVPKEGHRHKKRRTKKGTDVAAREAEVAPTTTVVAAEVVPETGTSASVPAWVEGEASPENDFVLAMEASIPAMVKEKIKRYNSSETFAAAAKYLCLANATLFSLAERSNERHTGVKKDRDEALSKLSEAEKKLASERERLAVAKESNKKLGVIISRKEVEITAAEEGRAKAEDALVQKERELVALKEELVGRAEFAEAALAVARSELQVCKKAAEEKEVSFKNRLRAKQQWVSTYVNADNLRLIHYWRPKIFQQGYDFAVAQVEAGMSTAEMHGAVEAPPGYWLDPRPTASGEEFDDFPPEDFMPVSPSLAEDKDPLSDDDEPQS